MRIMLNRSPTKLHVDSRESIIRPSDRRAATGSTPYGTTKSVSYSARGGGQAP